MPKINMLDIRRYGLIVVTLLLSATVSYAQTAHKFLRKADGFYENGNFTMAEENYRKALDKQPTDKSNFNLGNAIYQQQRYDDAITQYSTLAAKSKDKTVKAHSLYNKGNAHYVKKEYEQAVNAYKESLRLNPKDDDAKINLAKARKMMEEQQKQQQQQNQDKKNDKKDKQNQKQNQNQQQDQQQDQQPQKNKKQQSQQDLKKEDAKRMLQVMDDEERKVQQRMKKGDPKPARSPKDW